LPPGIGEEAPAALPGGSIILAARDKEDALPATLDSLLKLDYPDYEIVLVDNDSTDGPVHAQVQLG
jgi:glycosyltransferase involved in cell wall biosynthesis